MDNLEEMDKFLEKYTFPKLNQEEIEDLNKPITSKEIETEIRNLPANKAQDQMAPQLNSTKRKILKEVLQPQWVAPGDTDWSLQRVSLLFSAQLRKKT